MPIYKDTKRGTYFVKIYINGREIRRRGFSTRAAAKKAEALLLTEKPSTRLKVSTLIDDFLNYKKDKVTASTLTLYTQYNEWYYSKFFNNKYAEKVDYKIAEQFRESINPNFSTPYKNKILHVIRQIWNYGIKFHGLQNNPWLLIEHFKDKKENIMLVWTVDEFNSFLGKIDNDKMKALFSTLYWTGMRIGELRGLKWNDVDLINNTIHIHQQFSRYAGLTEPKTASSNREIDIDKSLSMSLKTLKNEASQYNGFNDDWFVFGSLTPIAKSSIDWFYKRAIKDSGVKYIRLHDLRHSHASWLLANKFDIAYISKRLGHSSINTTLSVYAHLMDDTRQREKQKLEKLVPQ